MARSTFKVMFYVNGSKEKNGIVPILGRVTINGTVAQFSCKRTIPKELWDAKGNKAKGKSMEARETNLALDNIKAQSQERTDGRQAKQIQEIRNAYEQQHRKLSEFVDFVKRYFPYVEKLIPTIKFIRETLNFGDAVIRKLCTFKDVSIKGELYSREFNQHFKVDKTVCSLKEDEEGKFELNIDGVSHISWFRRKKDEFMETLGMPTRKQNRGIKL